MKVIKKYQYAIFASVMTIIVLWQLLLPGYVLLLDWVVGPVNILEPKSAFNFMSLPIDGLRYLLATVLPMWVVQKVMLIALVFSLFYVPLKFDMLKSLKFKAESNTELKNKNINTKSFLYFSSLLFALNPWVYERLLTGQWRVVAGYMLMMPLVYYLMRYYKMRGWREVLGIFGVLMLLQILSSHFFIIGSIVAGLFATLLIIADITRLKWRCVVQLLKKFSVAGALFILVSMYWIVPFTLSESPQVGMLSSFDSAHIEAFATAGETQLDKVGTVLMMHGMWLEHEPWIDRFVLPRDGVLWYFGFGILMFFIGIGLVSMWQGVGQRFALGFLLVIAVASVVFGIGNMWMFEHVSIWSGFRDGQKWIGVLTLVYVLLASVGVQWVALKVKSKREELKVKSKMFKVLVLAPLFLSPLLMMPMMLFGFAGQLNTTWYPQEWAEVNDTLVESTKLQVQSGNKFGCKVIFLPWQQYYHENFNNYQLIANPAKEYFNCEVLSGQNMELGDVHIVAGLSDEEYLLDSAVLANGAEPFLVLNYFRDLGVTHIIHTQSVPYYYHAYNFIPYGVESGELSHIRGLSGIDLYELHGSI